MQGEKKIQDIMGNNRSHFIAQTLNPYWNSKLSIHINLFRFSKEASNGE